MTIGGRYRSVTKLEVSAEAEAEAEAEAARSVPCASESLHKLRLNPNRFSFNTK